MTHPCSMCRQPVDGDVCCCARCHVVGWHFLWAGHPLPPPERLDLGEFWLPAAGYATRYEISTFGRVRSLATRRILSLHGTRYPTVTLGGHRVRVHVVMAATFLGPRPPGYQVLHADDDKRNNWIGNLTYGTPSDNLRDAHRHGVRRRRCPSGRHLVTATNVYRRSDGVRVCLDCVADRERRDPRSWRAWAIDAQSSPDDWDTTQTGRAGAVRAGGGPAPSGRCEVPNGPETGYEGRRVL